MQSWIGLKKLCINYKILKEIYQDVDSDISGSSDVFIFL